MYFWKLNYLPMYYGIKSKYAEKHRSTVLGINLEFRFLVTLEGLFHFSPLQILLRGEKWKMVRSMTFSHWYNTKVAFDVCWVSHGVFLHLYEHGFPWQLFALFLSAFFSNSVYYCLYEVCTLTIRTYCEFFEGFHIQIGKLEPCSFSNIRLCVTYITLSD